MSDLTDTELAEIIGDGTCTHLPFVRMALEIRRRRPDGQTTEPGVTADALTPEQVRVARQAFRYEIEELIGLVHDCSDLLQFSLEPKGQGERRQRICAAINARRGAPK